MRQQPCPARPRRDPRRDNVHAGARPPACAQCSQLLLVLAHFRHAQWSAYAEVCAAAAEVLHAFLAPAVSETYGLRRPQPLALEYTA